MLLLHYSFRWHIRFLPYLECHINFGSNDEAYIEWMYECTNLYNEEYSFEFFLIISGG